MNELGYYKGKSPLTERFVHAIRGLEHTWERDLNFRIEIFIAVGVVGAMMILPLSGTERAILILIMALVLSLEITNSVFERFIDLVHPQFSPEVRAIKDTMAGAVLLVSTASVMIGLFILTQPLLEFDSSLQNRVEILRTASWVGVMRSVTLLGDWKVLAAATGLLALLFLSRKRYEFLGLLLGGIGIGAVVLLALKYLFGRERPPGADLWGMSTHSFPSWHVFMGTVFWFIIGYVLTHGDRERKYLWVVPGIVISLIAFSRIILSVHWFSDIVAGFLLGLFWFLFWFGINKRIFQK